MTDEQKQRKLEALENYLHWAKTASPAQRARTAIQFGLDPADAIQLAANLRRQLAGEPPPASTSYHVSKRQAKK